MKVKTLHCSPINVMGYKSTFQAKDHVIVFDKEAQGFIIDDKVFVPMVKVSEVALEPKETIVPVIEPVIEVVEIKKPKKLGKQVDAT